MLIEIARRRPAWPTLRQRMDGLVATFGPEHLSPDPLEVVRRFDAADDIEVVGFLGAALAFGSARGAVGSLGGLLGRLGGPPASAVRAWNSARDRSKLRGWRHRWLGEADAAATMDILGQIVREHGSIEAFFALGDTCDGDVEQALSSFCQRALRLGPNRAPRHLAFWFAGPGRGGSAKRLCLFLRWMCRHDGLDPGPWKTVDPSRLIIPLDTHVARLARYTGLLRRRSADWKAAVEVTSNLRRFDARDPVKYDYALCRLGILQVCPRRRAARRCSECPLFDVCLL